MSIYLSHNTERLPRTEADPKAWFPQITTWGEAHNTWYLVTGRVEQWGKKHFSDRVVMRSTPAGYGMQLLNFALPEGIRYEALPDGISKILHGAASLPHRFETFNKAKGGFEHDARVAFLSHCRNVPVYMRESFTQDDGTTFEPYREGWYLCEVTVPKGWQHIGLVPSEKVTKGDQPTYVYPNTPGTTFTYWLHRSEVWLLKQHKWPFSIRRRMLFAPQQKEHRGTDTLRLWMERLADGIEKAEEYARVELDQRKEWEWFRGALRAAALHTIGMFNFNGKAEGSQIFNGDEWVDVPTRAATPYTLRYHHPEWWAAITARTRVQTTLLALKVAPSDLIAIRGDAVITKSPIPGLVDTGKVGAYRLKGTVK